MENFIININMGNSAFEKENASIEISRILIELAEKIKSTSSFNHSIRDINGNKVGFSKTI